ncbi:MAG: decarboxylase, partial [Bacillota bacterium]
MRLDQNRMPLVEAMEAYLAEEPYRLHMPGHQGGQAVAEALLPLLGQQAFKADLTEIPGLDDLHQPQGAIKEAQLLAAEAFGAKDSFFLVNGATAGIEAAFLAFLKPGDKIFLPRHAHRSVFSALVLSGAY